jgi:CRP/FNR family transcriptional regulator
MELVEAVAPSVSTSALRGCSSTAAVVSASHQVLADELGSAREVISRLLGSFETRGWVKLERERVTVTDPKSLSALAAG